jgi:hypothetical protein
LDNDSFISKIQRLRGVYNRRFYILLLFIHREFYSKANFFRYGTFSIFLGIRDNLELLFYCVGQKTKVVKTEYKIFLLMLPIIILTLFFSKFLEPSLFNFSFAIFLGLNWFFAVSQIYSPHTSMVKYIYLIFWFLGFIGYYSAHFLKVSISVMKAFELEILCLTTFTLIVYLRIKRLGKWKLLLFSLFLLMIIGFYGLNFRISEGPIEFIIYGAIMLLIIRYSILSGSLLLKGFTKTSMSGREKGEDQPLANVKKKEM